VLEFAFATLLTATSLAATTYPEPDRNEPRPKTGDITEQYKEVVQRIVKNVIANNDSWHKMQVLCDDIGHRLSGSKRLEDAIAWAAATMKREGQENVRLDPVMVPHWTRGRESLVMLQPQEYEMSMLGLGMSVGTPAEGLTAEVITVKDKEDLDAKIDEVKGRIVLFNYPMRAYSHEHGSGYGTTVQYRVHGAKWAAEKGAVGCLVRSVTANSLRSPHTGGMRYGDAEVKIPAAAITIEDAEMMARLNKRGVYPKVRLNMEAKNHGEALSHNVIGELVGREIPEEIVVIGGHIDAWDVGHGAHDDAAGCVMAMEAINALRKMNLVPRRTIRVVLWTNEENGLAGGKAYAKDHADELDNHVVAIESDAGAYAPRGYGLSCSDSTREALAVQQLTEIIGMIDSIDNLSASAGGGGADISPMKEFGVIQMGHRVDGTTYFNIHHTHADTLDKVDPDEMSQNVAMMTAVAYVIADMPKRLGSE
jgi:hypothetical protein